MNDRYLFDVKGTGFHAIACEQHPFAELQMRLQFSCPDAVVRRIRGHKSRTLNGFFDEVAATLQFPYYFGENWSAFRDCILDRSWLPGNAYVLMFADAHLLFDQASEANLTALNSCLQEVHAACHPDPAIAPDVKWLPFHVVFQSPEANQEMLVSRLTSAKFVLDPEWPGSDTIF
ncbi:barstar family protein [Anabaena minutissima FACHB-250]|nr:barstar family protein [Anabaena minutissima FACHB-250]